MEWSEICENPILKDLPFKTQTDKWGNIVMSPASNRHGMYQAKIAVLIANLIETGTIISECSVATSEGVKVADVAWASREFLACHGDANPFPEAPEICVEILSPSNSTAEMQEKKELYFARGAREFWVCNSHGQMSFYRNTGPLPHSELIQQFPPQVEL